MMLFHNTEKFLKSLKQGQVIKYRGFLSDETFLSEFGHYDENEDKVYWQTACVLLRNTATDDKVVNTGKIVYNGRIYEQVCADSNVRKSFIRLASEKETKRFYEAYDRYIAKKIIQKKMTADEIYKFPENSTKISRTRLAVSPPKYMYAKDGHKEYIFKASPLTLSNECFFDVNYQEMILIDDELKLQPDDCHRLVCDYDFASIVREATDTERKLLVVQAKQKQEKEERERKQLQKISKMDFSELLDTKIGTVLYTYDGYATCIFPYGGLKRIEGIELVCYKEGCLRICSTYQEFKEDHGTKPAVRGFNSLEVLRLAEPHEISAYEEEKKKHTEKSERFRQQTICNIVAALEANARKREAKVKKKVVLIEKEDMKKDVDKRTEERRIAELQRICDRMKTFHTKILVSKGPGFAWFPALYGYLTKQRKVMVVGGTIYKHCLLYKDHRRLLGHLYNYEDVPPEKPEK